MIDASTRKCFVDRHQGALQWHFGRDHATARIRDAPSWSRLASRSCLFGLRKCYHHVMLVCSCVTWQVCMMYSNQSWPMMQTPAPRKLSSKLVQGSEEVKQASSYQNTVYHTPVAIPSSFPPHRCPSIVYQLSGGYQPCPHVRHSHCSAV
jgi:hypothetical protein